MARVPLIAGNWKMYLGLEESVALAREVAASAARISDREVMIAPSATALAEVARALDGSGVVLAAQNVAWAPEGALTGEISPVMLRELGVEAAIIGHSERRHIFGENDAMINRRLTGALESGLQVILCVGETLEEREEERTREVLAVQVREGLAGIDGAGLGRVVIAYEPVWAIGTGRTAGPEQAQEAHLWIRDELSELFEKNLAQQVRILYGGSVKPENVDGLMAMPDVDGALVGGAALKADSFDRIIHFQ